MNDTINTGPNGRPMLGYPPSIVLSKEVQDAEIHLSEPVPMNVALRLLAPYIAVSVFWCGLSDAWLTILAYHAQILFWQRGARPTRSRQQIGRLVVWALPVTLAGPLLFWLLPHITHTDLPTWLADYRLTGRSLILMIPYFGLVHPLLEQLHWRELRERGAVAHLCFAGYHLLVLYTLLTPPWLAVCFTVLVAASIAWRFLATRPGGPTAVVVSYALADFGVVVAAWLRS